MEDSFLRKNQKLIWLIISIPILATFSITSSVLMTCERQEPTSRASFRLPSGKEVKLGPVEFQDMAQNLRALSMMSPYFLYMLGIAQTENSEDQVYHYAMLVHAAQDAGIVVPKATVNEMIRRAFPTKEAYQSMLSRNDMRLTAQGLEEYLRRALSVQTYKGMLSGALSVPDGEGIVKSWQENNEEYKLEYVAFSAAEIRKGIDAAKVTDEELKTYFDGLAEPEKNRNYWREAKAAFEGAALKLASADEAKFAALLEGEKFEENDYRQYFNANKIFRFKRPPEEKPAEKKEEKKAEDAKSEGEAVPRPWTPFFEFEEVKERVEKEVRLKKALEKILALAKDESAKEGFSWESFGKPYGLEAFAIADLKTRAELQQLPRFGTVTGADQVLSLNEGELCTVVGLAPEDFFLYRVTKKSPAGVPALAEIREKVLENYLDKKAMDTAKEEAKAFHALCLPPKTETPAEEKKEGEKAGEIVHPPMQDLFAKALEAKSLKSMTLDFFSKSGHFKPEHWKEPEGATKFLKAYQPVFAKKAGEITDPIEDTANKSIYVVRVVERRMPDPVAITPRDFETEKQSWPQRSRMKAEEASFSFESLKKSFQFQETEASGRS